MVSFSPYVSSFSEQAGRVMLALAQGNLLPEAVSNVLEINLDETLALLNLLEALAYVHGNPDSGYKPLIPVLPQEDARLVEDVLTKSGDILVNWLPENMDELRESLSGITPLKYGLTFEEVFSQVWHYLFGLTNRRLVESGFFSDPYTPTRKYRGFIPCVWHPDIMPEETTF
jgi:hypothetical protein